MFRVEILAKRSKRQKESCSRPITIVIDHHDRDSFDAPRTELIDDLWGLAVIGNHDRDSPFVTMSLFPSS
jgi:hypothetical protein